MEKNRKKTRSENKKRPIKEREKALERKKRFDIHFMSQCTHGTFMGRNQNGGKSPDTLRSADGRLFADLPAMRSAGSSRGGYTPACTPAGEPSHERARTENKNNCRNKSYAEGAFSRTGI